jgi:hypothetical protein
MIQRIDYCKHNVPLVCCPECLDAWRQEENRRWIAKQRKIKEAYRGIEAAKELYISICGDPYSAEAFH